MDGERVSSFDRNDMSLAARRAREVATTRTSRSSPSPAGRRVMDIEDVVQWTIRDELPKQDGSGGVAGNSFPSCSPMFRMVDLGVPIDECNFSFEPGHPQALGAPHADALKVAAAIAALSRFRDTPVADELLDLGSDFAADPKDEADAMAHAMGSIEGLVIRSAKLRQRPVWQSTPCMEKVVGFNGKPSVLRWEVQPTTLFGGEVVQQDVLVPVAAEKRGTYPDGAYCPLRYDRDPRRILADRAEYLAWWAALNALADDLFGTLDTIAVLPPSAAQKPWLGEQELGKPPRVFDDLTARIYQRERRETAAAHRALGLRRVQAGRRGVPAVPIARRPPRVLTALEA